MDLRLRSLLGLISLPLGLLGCPDSGEGDDEANTAVDAGSSSEDGASESALSLDLATDSAWAELIRNITDKCRESD